MLKTAAGGGGLVGSFSCASLFLASLSEAVTYLHPNPQECLCKSADKTHKPIEDQITFWINNTHLLFT